ncbi:hypothetical protein DIPPA_22460 [Diplonema papillatum]|nr:hypothetical protein DIPPA_22460 [Diplonema papillatum]
MATRGVRKRILGTYAERVAEFDPSQVIGDWFPFESERDLPHPLQLARDLAGRQPFPARLKDAQLAFLLKQCQRRARAGAHACKAAEADKAGELFDLCGGPRMRGVHAKTALLSVYAAAGRFKPAAALYNGMRAQGAADESVFVNMMVCAENVRDLREVFRTVFQLFWSGLTATNSVYRVLFRACLGEGRVDLFWRVFASFARSRGPGPQPSLPAVCAEADRLVQGGGLRLAVVLSCGLRDVKVVLRKFAGAGGGPGRVALDPAVFEALLGKVAAGGTVHDLRAMAGCDAASLALERSDETPNLFARGAAATTVGDRIPPRELQTRRVTVAGVLLQHGLLDEADAVLAKLARPSAEHCELLLLRARDDAAALRRVLPLLEAAGFDDRRLYSPLMLLRLVDCYAATGILVAAERAVAQCALARHASSNYASLLAGYARLGDFEGVESALRRLGACTLQPLHYGVMSALVDSIRRPTWPTIPRNRRPSLASSSLGLRCSLC